MSLILAQERRIAVWQLNATTAANTTSASGDSPAATSTNWIHHDIPRKARRRARRHIWGSGGGCREARYRPQLSELNIRSQLCGGFTPSATATAPAAPHIRFAHRARRRRFKPRLDALRVKPMAARELKQLIAVRERIDADAARITANAIAGGDLEEALGIAAARTPPRSARIGTGGTASRRHRAVCIATIRLGGRRVELAINNGLDQVDLSSGKPGTPASNRVDEVR